MPRRVAAVIAVACLTWVAGVSSFGQFLALDPRLEWKTLETEHYHVIYHEGLDELAQEAAAYSEAAFEFWAQEIDYTPPFKITVIFADLGDLSAGAANPLTHDTIQGTSEARSFNEWLNSRTQFPLENVLFHEIGHVFDLAKVGGVPAALREVFGSIASPNFARPGAFVEGIPIYVEFARRGASRANDPREAMYLRTMLLNDQFIPLDQLLNSAYARDEFPSSYMLDHNYGSWMVRYMADVYGRESIATLDEINSQQLLPLLTLGFVHDFGGVLAQTVGVSSQEFYQGFQDWLQRLFAPDLERIQAEGVTESLKVSPLPYWNNKPDYSPDGQWIAYYHFDPARNGSVRLVRPDGQDDHMLLSIPLELPFFRPPFWAAAPAWSPDGRQLVYHKHAMVDQHYLLGDLYLYDVNARKETRLTKGIRGYNPVWYPDGKRILFAQQNRFATGTDLLTLELDSGRIALLNTFPAGLLLDSFEVSPDGEQIVISLWQRGFQDIYLMPSEGGALAPLTQDQATDSDPSWAPDGEVILFQSDRDGVNNLYAYNLTNQSLSRVTNALTGAFAPDVPGDGAHIAFVGYNADGYELHTMGYQPESWEPVQVTMETLPSVPALAEVSGQVRAYNPASLMSPKFWIPLPGLGGQIGALTLGNDPLNFHTYFLMGGINLADGLPFYSLNYANTQFYPTASLDMSGSGRDHKQALTITLPLVAQLHEQHSLSGGIRQLLQDQEPDRHEFFAGWQWHSEAHVDLWAQQQTLSIQGQLAHVVGEGDLEQRYELDWRQLVRLPLESEHQVGLRTALGWSDARPIEVGGESGTYLLRGYEPGALKGLLAFSSSVEYRFPVWKIERAPFGLWPLFLDDLRGSLYVDAGAAGAAVDSLDIQLGVGAELQQSLTAGFLFGLQINAGIGYGVGEAAPQLYMRFGSAF